MGKIYWGVFKKEQTNTRHVAPCTAEGDVTGGHILDEICICEPRLECDIVIHNHEV